MIEFKQAPNILNEHFGPCYAEENLYFNGQIDFEDCVNITNSSFSNRDEKIRYMAYCIWKKCASPTEQNWLDAEKAMIKYEKEWSGLVTFPEIPEKITINFDVPPTIQL